MTGMGAVLPMFMAKPGTETFDVLRDRIGFGGDLPIWGVGVGSERPKPPFLPRVLLDNLKENPRAILDALKILAQTPSNDTPRPSIPICLFRFDSVKECHLAVQTLRKCLPEHLRDCIQVFYPNSPRMCEEGNVLRGERLKKGHTRLVCSTDAAGMGCNVTDIDYSFIHGLPRGPSESLVAQRRLRAPLARDRKREGAWILLVIPLWAFRPVSSDRSGMSRSKGLEKDKFYHDFSAYVNGLGLGIG
ncbi:hypothetical protein BD410DRAFT_895637 [Rickenella mellea]|uniref:Helicase C-terminal domain-containing protein n=1 Tax=Rickenella mellea TaxID=50990 RepID=A0A4Y7QFU7_9AGAM|nr:hypothetical protein BD410DRAFT_895637 [Rickenella mellea]